MGVDVGSMLVVTLNGMKLLPSSRKVRQNELRSRTGEGLSDSRGSSTSGLPSQPLLEVSNNDSIDDNFVEEDQPCCSNGGACCNNKKERVV